MHSFGQSQCSDAESDLNYAYSHVKSAYDSNNVTHLKYYANRSLESFKRAKPKLNTCNCTAAYNNVYDSIELLAKVDGVDKYEDGRFYVKRARELAKQTIIDLDKCTVITTEDEVLLALESEKSSLEQQQLELKQREQALKLKLAEQKDKELLLKKEQLINAYKSVISTNVKTYNDALKVCDCETQEILVETQQLDTLATKSIEDIKFHYIKNLKGLTSTYLSQLNLCDE